MSLEGLPTSRVCELAPSQLAAQASLASQRHATFGRRHGGKLGALGASPLSVPQGLACGAPTFWLASPPRGSSVTVCPDPRMPFRLFIGGGGQLCSLLISRPGMFFPSIPWFLLLHILSLLSPAQTGHQSSSPKETRPAPRTLQASPVPASNAPCPAQHVPASDRFLCLALRYPLSAAGRQGPVPGVCRHAVRTL